MRAFVCFPFALAENCGSGEFGIQSAIPPSSGFATFSPRKKRGGRRRSIGELGGGLEFLNLRLNDLYDGRVELLNLHLAETPNRAPSPHRSGEKVAGYRPGTWVTARPGDIGDSRGPVQTRRGDRRCLEPRGRPPKDRAMEADVLWKAAMRPRLPTGLGKRPPTTTRVSHISHSPLPPEKEREGEPRTTTRQIKSVTYVPGPMCYLCSRSYTEGRMRGPVVEILTPKVSS